jgi:hypothetical protein
MANRRAINLDILPELLNRHRGGESLRSLSAWLITKGCKVSIETIRAELARSGQAAQERPEVVLPEAEPEAMPDCLRVLRYEIAQERREARLDRARDWKRYHSALRLTKELYKLDARPASKPPGNQPEPPPKPQTDHVIFLDDPTFSAAEMNDASGRSPQALDRLVQADLT